MNKLLPRRRDKHLLFSEGTTIAFERSTAKVGKEGAGGCVEAKVRGNQMGWKGRRA